MTSVSIDRTRKGSLDLLRAIAILMVVVYHSAHTMPSLRSVTNYGEYGVDLFFVLSGWLVGGLYWRERASFVSVNIVGFWIRRWLRTLPPYFVALLLSWLAVRIMRNEPFDFGYLAFIQNYYRQPPFFLVSWSLCVEEHFYLLTPLLLLAWPQSRKINDMWFILLLVTAPLSRFAIYNDDYSLYFRTASHLRMDGLILGLWLSYLAVEEPERFHRLASASPYGVLAGLVGLVCLVLTGGRAEYALWGIVLALFFSAVLVYLVSRQDISAAVTRVASPIALASYSAYLTHAWAVYVALKLVERQPSLGAIYFPIAFLLVASFSILFYFGIERPSIAFRDRLWPRRGDAPAQRARVTETPVKGKVALAANTNPPA